MSGGKNNKAKSVVLTVQNVLLRERGSPCLLVPLAALVQINSNAGKKMDWQFRLVKEKAEPWGLFDLSVLEESICFCRLWGKQAFYIMVFDETASWVQLELSRRKPASVEGKRR